MPYNTSTGVFTVAVTFADNTDATAEDQNTQDGDLASGLSQAMTRGGYGAATANWPMGGYKLTNLGTGSASGDSVNYGQLTTTQWTLAQLPSMANDTILGNISGVLATPTALTAAQTATIALIGSTSGFGIAINSGAQTISVSSSAPPYPYDVPVNMGLSAAASVNALTITLMAASGSAPTSANPVLVPFRSTTLTNGAPVWAAITGTKTITIPSSASLGVANSVVSGVTQTPFRIWIFLCYNGGTPELGVAVCSSPLGTIYPASAWETTGVTTTTISSGATSSGVVYAPIGVASDAVRIIGYAEYGSGLATPGTWVSGPTLLQLYGPGIKKPGDVVQTVTSAFGTLSVATFTTLAATNITLNITPTSSLNLVKYYASSTLNNNNSGTVQTQIYRGSTAIGNLTRSLWSSSAGSASFSLLGYDFPATTSATTYVVKGTSSSSNGTIPAVNTDSATEILDEIMG